MTTPALYPLDLYRGDTFRVKFKLWKNKEKTDPVDLTGVSVAAQIRASATSSAILQELSCVVTDPNIIEVSMTPEESGRLPASGVWDLQLTYPDTDIQTILAGPVKVTADVTRSAAP